jgi:hypothetical protein
MEKSGNIRKGGEGARRFDEVDRDIRCPLRLLDHCLQYGWGTVIVRIGGASG